MQVDGPENHLREVLRVHSPVVQVQVQVTPIYPEIGHENSRFLSTNWTLEKGERNLYCRFILEPGIKVLV